MIQEMRERDSEKQKKKKHKSPMYQIQRPRSPTGARGVFFKKVTDYLSTGKNIDSI